MFPNILGWTGGFGADTILNAVLPTGYQSGELGLALVATEFQTVTWPSGWSSLGVTAGEGTNSYFSSRYRIFDGSETGSITLTLSSDPVAASYYRIFRISGYNPLGTPEVAGSGGFNSSQLNFQSLSPSWGSGDTLWIAAAAVYDGAGSAAMTGTPIGYSGCLTINTNIEIHNCQLQSGVATQQPSAYLFNGNHYGSTQLIAIEGVDDVVVPPTYATGALKFFGSQFMQATSTGVIGSGINTSTAIKFDNPNLSLTVSDRIKAVSTSTVDTGISINIIGRNTVGALQNEFLGISGLTTVASVLTFRNILRVNSPTTIGSIVLTKFSNNSGLLTLPSGATGINRPFFKPQKDAVSYEKVFLKNTSNVAIANIRIGEVSNPSGAFTFALANVKNDTESVSSLTVAPTACSVFSNSTTFMPGNFLGTGDAIGIWIRGSGQYDTAPYILGGYGSLVGSG
jgi:hypothetical protein